MSQRLAIVHNLHSGQTLNATYYQHSAYTIDALELTRDMLNYLSPVVEQLAIMPDLDPDTIQGLFNVALATYVTQQGGCVKQSSLQQLSRFNGALPLQGERGEGIFACDPDEAAAIIRATIGTVYVTWQQDQNGVYTDPSIDLMGMVNTMDQEDLDEHGYEWYDLTPEEIEAVDEQLPCPIDNISYQMSRIVLEVFEDTALVKDSHGLFYQRIGD